MGYTHYWNYKKPSNNFDSEFINVQLDITLGLRHLNNGIVLRGGDGTGNPEFTPVFICFNGDGEQGLDHETFYFDGKPSDFDFCKTNRKPYDFFVCFCLLSLSNRIEGFDFSSDGDIEEWKPVIDFYEKFIGELKPSITEKFSTLIEKD
jgi:hypothetical protein